MDANGNIPQLEDRIPSGELVKRDFRSMVTALPSSIVYSIQLDLKFAILAWDGLTCFEEGVIDSMNNIYQPWKMLQSNTLDNGANIAIVVDAVYSFIEARRCRFNRDYHIVQDNLKEKLKSSYEYSNFANVATGITLAGISQFNPVGIVKDAIRAGVTVAVLHSLARMAGYTAGYLAYLNQATSV